MPYKYHLLFLLLLWGPLSIAAQSIVFQDPQQFIWYIDNGTVHRFDGYSVHPFSASDGLPNTPIRSLFFDAEKRLWLFSDNTSSLFYFDSLHISHTISPDIRLSMTIGKVGEVKDTLFFEDKKTGKWLFLEKNKSILQQFYGQKHPILQATYAQEQLPAESPLFFDRKTKTIQLKHMSFPPILKQSVKIACLLSNQKWLLATSNNRLILAEKTGKNQSIDLIINDLPEFRNLRFSITSLANMGEFIFIGTNKGLIVVKNTDLNEAKTQLNPADFNITTTQIQRLKPYENYIRLGKIHQILPNTEGGIIATENGLFLFKTGGRTLQRLTEKYDNIGAVLDTSVFASGDSLVSKKQKIATFKRDSRITGLTYDNVERNIWGIKESGGVFCVKKGETESLAELKDIVFTQIVSDTEGAVWALSKTQLIKIFNSGNGFKTQRFDAPEGTQQFLLEGDIIHFWGEKGWFSALKTALKRPSMLPNIMLKSIKIGGEEKPLTQNEYGDLEINDRTVIAQFTAISPASMGDILYAYRFIEIDKPWYTRLGFTKVDTSWEYTHNRELTQPLHAGRYRLEISAINKFGVATSPLSKNFNVAPEIWGRWWFWLLSITVIASIIFGIFKVREQQFKQRNRRLKLERNLAEVELKALQTQMDAHFVANVLTAIQGFIQNRERSVANKYIVEFYKLIRLFLDSSINNYHSLDKEMELLEKYIFLKQLLIPFEFDKIDIGQDNEDDYLDPTQIKVPTSLFQPFVENAVEHGLSRRKVDEKRLLSIRFTQLLDDDTIICIIEDTGIGRQKALKIQKNKGNKENFSKQVASKIIQKRAKTLNAINPNTLFYEYEDLTDENGNATGTRVVIKTQFSTSNNKKS
jgi:hypothetical protein